MILILNLLNCIFLRCLNIIINIFKTNGLLSVDEALPRSPAGVWHQWKIEWFESEINGEQSRKYKLVYI